MITNDEVYIPSKRWNLLFASALIGLSAFLILSFFLQITIYKMGVIAAAATSAVCAIYGVILVIVLSVGALVYSKCNNNRTSCLIGAGIEFLLMVMVFLFNQPLLRLFDFPREVYHECVLAMRITSCAGIFSTIIAGLVGVIIKKKSIKPDIIIYSVVFFFSVIITVIGIFGVNSFNSGMAGMAIGIGLFQAFVSVIPCSLQEPTRTISQKTHQTAVTQRVMFCPNCGKRYDSEKLFCDQCGSELKETITTETIAIEQSGIQDAPSIGFGVLGFFFPAVGLVLYLVWRDSLPCRAKSTGKGALAGTITYVALIILIFAVRLALLRRMFYIS